MPSLSRRIGPQEIAAHLGTDNLFVFEDTGKLGGLRSSISSARSSITSAEDQRPRSLACRTRPEAGFEDQLGITSPRLSPTADLQRPIRSEPGTPYATRRTVRAGQEGTGLSLNLPPRAHSPTVVPAAGQREARLDRESKTPKTAAKRPRQGRRALTPAQRSKEALAHRRRPRRSCASWPPRAPTSNPSSTP
jgi:hypothetical protein